MAADLPAAGQHWRYKFVHGTIVFEGKVLALDEHTAQLQPVRPHGLVVIRPRADVLFLEQLNPRR